MLKLLCLISLLIFSMNAFTCSTPTASVHDLNANSFYGDDHHSVIDPKLKKSHDDAVKPIEDFIRTIAKMSDRYIENPKKNLEEGNCANQWILSWAKDNAMLGEMKNAQSYSERKWMLAGIGLNYGKTKSLIKSEDNIVIEAWLKKLADLTITYSDQYKGVRNNHYYWEGLAVASVGVLTKDQKYLSWSKQVFLNTMDTIDKDGSLPREMERGKRAIHYHSFATAPLVMMSSLLDLDSEKLKSLVRFTYHALLDPSLIEKKLGVKQDPVTISNQAWLLVYLRRNKDKEIEDYIKDKTPLFYSKLGGNLALTNPLEVIK